MLSKEELEPYQKIVGFNLWQLERDYLQHLFLFFLSRRIASELIFKGETALQKTLGLNRFSINLDFTQDGELPENLFDSIAKDFSNFGFEADFREVKKKESHTLKLAVKGPLYQRTERTLTVFRIEISSRETIALKPETKEIAPIYPDLQPYLVKVMNSEEILAEKIRAIFTRSKARDVFDLKFLLNKNIPLNKNLVNQKLKNYHREYSKDRLLQEINKIKPIWKKELSQLVTKVPDYQEALQQIKEKI